MVTQKQHLHRGLLPWRSRHPWYNSHLGRVPRSPHFRLRNSQHRVRQNLHGFPRLTTVRSARPPKQRRWRSAQVDTVTILLLHPTCGSRKNILFSSPWLYDHSKKKKVSAPEKVASTFFPAWTDHPPFRPRKGLTSFFSPC